MGRISGDKYRNLVPRANDPIIFTRENRVTVFREVIEDKVMN